MEQLEMIKAFAELEGVELVEDSSTFYHANCVRMNCNSEYNPITKLALNCAARDKYEAEVDHHKGDVCIFMLDKKRKYTTGVTEVSFNCKSEIPLRVIECILKANGLWID